MGGKAFEKIFKPGGTTQAKHYIGGFAVVTDTDDGVTQTTATDYLLRDHLGSLDVITDETGAVVTKMSFDAWGKRREVNWTVMANPTLYQPLVTTRGFTGHEQLDSVGLVHMNGRVYDPELGRFLSADPFIQDTENLQAWNRYTYVLNNPLSLTDPDGFFFKKIFKAIGKAFGKVFNFLKKNFKAILRIAITALACANPGAPVTCAAVTIGTSFAFTLADGGSIGDALKAAAFAAVQVGVFRGVGLALKDIAQVAGAGFFAIKSAVHGVVGGALSMAQGGSFLQGFAANSIGAGTGMFSDAISQGDILLDTAIVAAAGGAAAELTGGKFANGALSAAFGNLFNKFAERLTRYGAAIGGTVGAYAGAAATTGACVYVTFGTCVPAAPATIAAGAGVGAGVGIGIGGFLGHTIGTLLDTINAVLTPATIHGGGDGANNDTVDETVITDSIENNTDGHRKNARPSTGQKHQEGDARRQRDYGGEKADVKRRLPRKRPKNWRGPWLPR